MVYDISRRLKRKPGKCTLNEMDSTPSYPILNKLIFRCHLRLLPNDFRFKQIMTEKKKTGKPTPKSIKKILAKMNGLYDQKTKELRIIEAAISQIKRHCSHVIVKDPRCDIAVCSTCGIQFTWYCDKSPVHHCEYEMGENCIHCGQPEERK